MLNTNEMIMKNNHNHTTTTTAATTKSTTMPITNSHPVSHSPDPTIPINIGAADQQKQQFHNQPPQANPQMNTCSSSAISTSSSSTCSNPTNGQPLNPTGSSIQQQQHQMSSSSYPNPRNNNMQQQQQQYIPTKLYVTNFPYTCTQRQINDLFAQYGQVVECTLKKDYYAYVLYTSNKSALKAYKLANGLKMLGRKLTVHLATSKKSQSHLGAALLASLQLEPDSPVPIGELTANAALLDQIPKIVHVRNFPETCSQEQVRQLFAQYGDIIECLILHDSYAFVHFKAPGDARLALQATNNQPFLNSAHNLLVQYSRSKFKQQSGVEAVGGGAYNPNYMMNRYTNSRRQPNDDYDENDLENNNNNNNENDDYYDEDQQQQHNFGQHHYHHNNQYNHSNQQAHYYNHNQNNNNNNNNNGQDDDYDDLDEDDNFNEATNTNEMYYHQHQRYPNKPVYNNRFNNYNNYNNNNQQYYSEAKNTQDMNGGFMNGNGDQLNNSSSSSTNNNNNTSQYVSCRTKLYITNFPEEMDQEEMKQLFNQYGHVLECTIMWNQYAFVHFGSYEEAEKAIIATKGMQYKGYKMSVQWSTSSKYQQPKQSKLYHQQQNTLQQQMNGEETENLEQQQQQQDPDNDQPLNSPSDPTLTLTNSNNNNNGNVPTTVMHHQQQPTRILERPSNHMYNQYNKRTNVNYSKNSNSNETTSFNENPNMMSSNRTSLNATKNQNNNNNVWNTNNSWASIMNNSQSMDPTTSVITSNSSSSISSS